MSADLFIFARFHAAEGQAEAVASVLHAQTAKVLTEPGCLAIEAFRSTRDQHLFYIHSRWQDEAAFEAHAALPDTEDFLARMNPLLDQPFEVTRTVLLGS